MKAFTLSFLLFGFIFSANSQAKSNHTQSQNSASQSKTQLFNFLRSSILKFGDDDINDVDFDIDSSTITISYGLKDGRVRKVVQYLSKMNANGIAWGPAKWFGELFALEIIIVSKQDLFAERSVITINNIDGEPSWSSKTKTYFSLLKSASEPNLLLKTADAYKKLIKLCGGIGEVSNVLSLRTKKDILEYLRGKIISSGIEIISDVTFDQDKCTLVIEDANEIRTQFLSDLDMNTISWTPESDEYTLSAKIVSKNNHSADYFEIKLPISQKRGRFRSVTEVPFAISKCGNDPNFQSNITAAYKKLIELCSR